jgi:hypothetical protein
LEEFVKKSIIVLFIAGVVLFSGCKSQAKAVKAPDYVEKTSAYEVVDHKTKSVGRDVPDWVTLYINDGVHGVESLPQYKDKYVFVGEDTGTNLNALRQWVSGFSVNQEISRLVSSRVQAKFAGAAAGSPEAAFGRYYENVVKTLGNARFSGARKETDFWIQKRYYKARSRAVDHEGYEFYVLVSIDKPLLEEAVNQALNGVESDEPLTREQKTAVDRVKEAFYEGF